MPYRKWVARFAFVAQGKGYKYVRKPIYDCNQNGAKSLLVLTISEETNMVLS